MQQPVALKGFDESRSVGNQDLTFGFGEFASCFRGVSGSLSPLSSTKVGVPKARGAEKSNLLSQPHNVDALEHRVVAPLRLTADSVVLVNCQNSKEYRKRVHAA